MLSLSGIQVCNQLYSLLIVQGTHCQQSSPLKTKNPTVLRHGHNLTLAPSMRPEVIPMVQITGFDERIKPAQSFVSPELARTFEASLSLGAGRFCRSTADRPAAATQRLPAQADFFQ